MASDPHFGKLPPQYIFVLNRYCDVRFTSCPMCEAKMKVRKLPLLIHIEPLTLIAMNKTCRYCPSCDLLIAHQDEIEDLLAKMFPDKQPLSSDDYLVLGTVERPAWKEGLKEPKGLGEMEEYIHDFREVRTITVQPGGWYPADKE